MDVPVIVGEVSKNWPNPDHTPIAVLFERLINKNLQRGYRLKDWKFDRQQTIDVQNGPMLVETIIAVFELRGAFEIYDSFGSSQ